MTSVALAELKSNTSTVAIRLKLMSHPKRLLMLCRLVEGEASVGELVELTGLSQSAVSQHLAMLRSEGAVTIRHQSQNRFYSLNDPIVRSVIESLCQSRT
jgi:DNA-binding transcriptional ArsR family regulator